MPGRRRLQPAARTDTCGFANREFANRCTLCPTNLPAEINQTGFPHVSRLGGTMMSMSRRLILFVLLAMLALPLLQLATPQSALAQTNDDAELLAGYLSQTQDM